MFVWERVHLIEPVVLTYRRVIFVVLVITRSSPLCCMAASRVLESGDVKLGNSYVFVSDWAAVEEGSFMWRPNKDNMLGEVAVKSVVLLGAGVFHESVLK
jgi:hypothetical protein